MKSYLPILILLLIFTHTGFCQSNKITFSLPEVLSRGLSIAIDLKLQTSQREMAQMENNLFDERQKPNFFLNGVVPNISRAIESRPLPDGRDAFVNRSTMYNSIGFAADYRLPGNYGTFTADTRIQRLDILRTNTLPYSRNYFFTPIKIGYQYTPFQFDERNWEKEQLRIFSTEMTLEKSNIREQVVLQIVTLYCQAFESQRSLEILSEAIINNDSLYQIQSRLFDIGIVNKIEILRLEAEKKRLLENKLELESVRTGRLIQLNEFLGLSETNLIQVSLEEPSLPLPDELTLLQVYTAFDQNSHFNYQNYAILRDAESEIERINQNKDYSIALSASAGANNSSGDIGMLLTGIQDQENLGITFSVPLNGYKERRISGAIAKEQYDQRSLSIELEKEDIKRELSSLQANYVLLQKRLTNLTERIAKSKEIYSLSKREYLNGLVTLTDLNAATRQLIDDTNNENLIKLQLMKTYCLIRSICLYDFLSNNSLVKAI